MNLARLIGSGHEIGRMMLPFAVAGAALNLYRPSLFAAGGPPGWLAILSVILLIPGIIIWGWSVFLILTRVPRRELITHGPYALVKHPLYTSVALLVLPSLGFLLDTWLGLLLGAVLYAGTRIFAPKEEAALAREFGSRWDSYRRSVILPWL